MDELQIFKVTEIETLKNLEKSFKDTYMGVVYAVEYGDELKIGHSAKPYTRILSLKRNAEKYGNLKLGRVCISEAHTNHRENEKKLHKHFASCRKPETELFDVTLDNFVCEANYAKLVFKDETAQINQSSQDFLRFMKKTMFGGAFNE